MGIFDSAKDKAGEFAQDNPDKLDQGVEKAGDFADDKTGEAVKLVIVRKGADLTEAQVRAFCKEHLTGYKRPARIEFRTDMPKTPVGKILRRELRDKP